MTSTKSKVAAGILGILFGSWGVHNFYLGYTKKAVIQLVCSLVAFFGAIFSYILAGLLSVIFIGILLFPVGMLFNAVQIGMAVWGVVEGILILTKNDATDADGYILTN